LDLNALDMKFKEGDELQSAFHAMSTDKINLFVSSGKMFTLSANDLPSARGFGESVRMMADIGAEEEIVHAFVLDAGAKYLLATRHGNGFIISGENCLAQTKNGKQVMNIDGNTDMKQNHRLDGSIHSMEIATRDTTFYPLDLNVEVKMNEKSMLARTNAGDMWIQFHADEGIDSLLLKTNAFIEELNAQVKDKQHDYDKAKALLPRVDVHVLCGKNNPLANVTRSMLGATFNHMSLDFISHPTTGING
jgi:DNA gyrase/topoisomerase IV subunit A